MPCPPSAVVPSTRARRAAVRALVAAKHSFPSSSLFVLVCGMLPRAPRTTALPSPIITTTKPSTTTITISPVSTTTTTATSSKLHCCFTSAHPSLCTHTSCALITCFAGKCKLLLHDRAFVTEQQMVWRRCFYPSTLGAKHGPNQSFHVPPCICSSFPSCPPRETACCPYPQGCLPTPTCIFACHRSLDFYPNSGRAGASCIITTAHLLPRQPAVTGLASSANIVYSYRSFKPLRYPLHDRLTSS
ncbi:hypothetical protein B0T20DRAFT_111389 [Sordaria brevicollis]|uniref:Uncharacterized protein n=1 Tax=Sordaria brevicollis TaxID=83679 RepID=A0AAE0NRV0_SORBR|nr:hypothetical protein B0T20DRAFT_111389 [Sordaria brevicollis]